MPVLFNFFVTMIEFFIHHIVASKLSKRKLLEVSLLTIIFFITILVCLSLYHFVSPTRLYQVVNQSIVFLYFTQFFKRNKLRKRVEAASLAFSFVVVFLSFVQPLLITLFMLFSLGQSEIFILTKLISLAMIIVVYNLSLPNKIFDFCLRNYFAKIIIYVMAIVSVITAIYSNFNHTLALLFSTVMLVTGIGIIGVISLRKSYKLHRVVPDEVEELVRGVKSKAEMLGSVDIN